MSKNIKRGRGRPSVFSDRYAFVNGLLNPKELSYSTIKKFIDADLLASEVDQNNKSGLCGRPPVVYVMTAKARRLMRLSQYRRAANDIQVAA